VREAEVDMACRQRLFKARDLSELEIARSRAFVGSNMSGDLESENHGVFACELLRQIWS